MWTILIVPKIHFPQISQDAQIRAALPRANPLCTFKFWRNV